MDKKEIQTSIKSYEKRLESRKADVIRFVTDGSWWNAQTAMGECIGFEAVIAELKFQLEVMEVNNA